MTRGLDWRVSYSLFTLGMALFGWLMWKLLVRNITRWPRG
jgi:hypothetical protein